jgi:hypothetical protein
MATQIVSQHALNKLLAILSWQLHFHAFVKALLRTKQESLLIIRVAKKWKEGATDVLLSRTSDGRRCSVVCVQMKCSCETIHRRTAVHVDAITILTSRSTPNAPGTAPISNHAPVENFMALE